ncbi:T9SS type B sorting domain-containing protein [Maribacter sp. BPC-D8]|uniref:T9SS type B sorting domain-containing protein n=1 Tax=Maribacter sp. BPC-D8 TaxID=3053613 RepID=UPI002B46D0C5|nr:T9SS type B sorting domain-containing protein [Maribacter sp. BPC-D8]WRI28742.1 T9SS type B sorting domain-containing protein [Maribacter sp. BPC-D8]
MTKLTRFLDFTKHTSLMGKQYSKYLFFILFLALGLQTAVSQVKNDFDVRYEADIRGELTFIANNIVNRYEPSTTRRQWVWRNGRWRIENVTTPEVSANTPLNATGSASNYNDNYDMRYIDVDSDTSTFSSSSANLVIPDVDCSLVRYAGLYWSAVYVNSDRSTIDDIKFRTPGGAYQDITADEIIFDGAGDADFGYYSPYAAYKDVTSIVTGLANPNGDYFVANVRASTGNSISGGISGGWKMVIVYENPNLPGDKFITTFDGYAGVKSGESIDIPVNGFTTLPAPFPVYANMGVAALEGDNRIGGDALQINANGSFTTLSNGQNPANNFFNSSITQFDTQYTTRNPNSINTLGWDVDLFEIPNGGASNTIIPNGATSAILRASSSQDKYDIFFTSFDVDIIAPNIVLEKRVQTPGGVDITGQGVHLGQTLDYVLTFENIGNDDGVNYTIRDVLPVNVSPPDGRSFFNDTDFTFPAQICTGTPRTCYEITYTYDPATREIVFSIPDVYVEDEDGEYSIGFRVQVAENCFDFIDACSDLIENLAYSSYRGENNSAQVTDDPSVTDFNTCGFVIPGATNFLLDDLSDCNFERTIELCGTSAILNAGDGFDSYIWYRDTNSNGEIDASDIEINDGDPDNDPSTQVVTLVGQYIVDKIVADPCKGFKEIITVEPFGSGNLPNPVTEYFNEVNGDTDPSNDIPGEIVFCSDDSSYLPKIFLCGINDSQPLAVNIVDAQSVAWERLVEGSCGVDVGEDCANRALTCTWTEVGTGSNYLLNAPGEYRLSVIYQNGCTSRFFFKGFQNNLDIDFNNRDIVCDTDGNITITNLGSGYGYQLVDNDTNATIVPFSANNGPSFDFASGENGSYRVEVTQLDTSGNPIEDACIFTTPVIGVRERAITYNVSVTPETCFNLGTVNLQITDANPPYAFELRIDDGANGGLGTLIDSQNGHADNNYTFTDVSAGDYIAYISTDDGCSYSESVTVIDENDLELTARVSQHITCREGNILMDSDGGKTPHTYAIWEYIDDSGNIVTSYPTYADIPATDFQSSQIFDILNPGDYVFVVLDRNGCYKESNTVTIEFQPAADFDATTVNDVLCFGESTGRIQYNLIDNNGYQLTFSLFDSDDQPLAENTTGLFPNLADGDYRVVINQRKGSASCDYEENYSISAPSSAISGTSVLIQDYTCLQEGIIEAQNVTGGTAPYEYSIDGINFVPDTTVNAHRFENLTDGTYNLIIRDATGCTLSTDEIVIDRPNPPTDLTIVESQITCPAQTVNLTVNAINGTAPYVYSIIAPATIAPTSTTGNEAAFDGLAPDTYTVRVTDADGCFYDENYTINAINPITANGQTTQPISCFGAADGVIRFNVNLQAGQNFTYTITGPTGVERTGGTEALIDNINNLAPGIYTIDIVDTDTNCIYSATHELEGPASALAISSLIETQPSCTSDGSVSVLATGGWGSYVYELSNPDATVFGSNTTGSFNGLLQTGTYNGTITDANNCSIPFTFDLNPATAPVLVITPNQDCFDDAVLLTLTASVSSGGDGTFEYSLNGGAFSGTNVFSGLLAGTYTIDVRDGNNCTDTESITIDPALTVNASASDITACGTDTDITIVGAGGDGNYVYAVVADGITPTAGDFNASNSVTVTGTGDYDVYVRDNSGAADFCETLYDITIDQEAPVAATPTIVDVTCFGGNNGSISLAPSGGEAPYRYSIDGGTFGTVSSFNNLTAGTYDVRVRDVNDCEVTLSVDVDELPEIVAESVQTEAYTCNQLAEITVGSVTPTTGGSGSYQYSLNGGIWTAATAGGTFYTDLTDNTYTVQVRDANNINCVVTLPEIIIAPLPTIPSLSSSVAYSCDGTGIITILPNDATYTYSIDGNTPQTNNVFSNAIVGQHTITVDYGSECTTDIIVTVEDGFQFEAAMLSYKDLDCNADNSGSITFEVANYGASGFEYSLDDFASILGSTTVSPQTISGLAAGSYRVYVRDAASTLPGCAKFFDQIIDEPTLVVADANLTQDFTCNNGGAEITASATGGTPGYMYQLEEDVLGIVTAYQTETVFNGLPAGTYYVRARDANGCSDLSDTPIVVTAPLTPVFTLQETVCYSGSNDATIVVDVTAGNGDYQFRINGGSYVTPAPVNATTYTFTGLSNGTYTVEVTDAFGCDAAAQTITIEQQVTVSASASTITACGTDSEINITAAGGDGNYVYAVVADGAIPTAGDYGTTNPVTVTGSGDYDVYVLDNNGGADACPAMYDINIAQDAPVAATPTVVDVTCFGGNNGSISLAPSGGEAPYTYSVDGGTTFGSVSLFNNLTAGTYDVRVRDVNDCEVTLSVDVDELPEIVAESIQTEDYTCNQLAEITVGSVTPTTGGSGSYQYSLNGGTWTAATAGGTVFTDLSDGTFTVQVRDANNIACVINLPNIIIAPLPTAPLLSSTVAYSCDGTGIITILPNDATYTYSIDGNTPQTGNVFNNATVGQHTITVDYGSECTTDIIVDVQDGNAFDAAILSYEDLDCNADNSGTITFEVENFGAGGYEYSYDSAFATIEGSDTAATHQITGLSQGTYTIYVRDVDNPIAGCTKMLTQIINEPSVLTVSNTPTQPTCIDDGAVNITVTGGTSAYSYVIELPNASSTPAQNSGIFTGLDQLGLHTITVTDANGCTETDTFTLTAPVAPVASILPSSDVCFDSSVSGSATIEVGATGGVAPYTYRMGTGTFTTVNTFASLTPGSYTFEIRDTNGCTDTVTFDIEAQLTATLTLDKDLDCTASPDATMNLVASGGYAPFTYELDVNGGGYAAFVGTFPHSTATAGTYRFRVTDDQGCTAVSNLVTVTATVNPVATETVTNPTCFGDANGIVEINIDPNFGSSPYEINFNSGGFSNQRVYTGLAAGTYTYIVRDSKECTYNGSVDVVDPVLFDANVVATDVSCGATGDIPGSIEITITSGGAPNFTYTLYDNLNNIATTTSPNPVVNTTATIVNFGGLVFGDYYVRVLDANGCEYYENPVRVLSNPYIAVDAVIPAVSCVTGGTVELTASGGSGNYDFTIYGAGTTPDTETPGATTDEEVATYNGLNPGQNYVFQVIDVTTGCSSYIDADIPNLSTIDVVPTPTVTDVACYGDTNGSIAFQFQGYDAAVTTINYELRESITNTPVGAAYSGSVTGPNGPGPTATETVSNIPPGDYVLFFQEAATPECTNTFEFRILEPNPVTLTLADQNNGYCSEDANVTVIAGGGNGSYTYAYVQDGATPVSGDYETNNYKELDPSVNTDWDIYVMDGNGCSTALPIDVTIADDPTPAISGLVINQCTADEGDFIIEITLDGEGSQPYTLSVNSGSYQSSTLTTAGTTHQFTDLSSGSYTVQVRDFNGCGNVENIEIFAPVSISAEVVAQPSCAEGDGEILIKGFGGSTNYEYELFEGGVSVNGAPQPMASFTGLDSGTYTAFVYDTTLSGCSAQVIISLELATPVLFTTVMTDVTCFGDSDGTIVATLDATMDNPVYEYQLYIRTAPLTLTPVGVSQTSGIFTNLPAEDYVVGVTSGRGCELEVDSPVNTPLQITNVNASVVEFGCTVGNNSNNATVTVDTAAITGGSSTYVTYEFIDSSSAIVQSGPSNVLTVIDRTGETYTINVYDDKGCSGSTTATVLPYDEMTGATAAVTTTVTCAPGSDGVITVTATSSASDDTKYEYSIDNGTSYVPTNVFSGLSAGNYNFLIRHTDTGCIVTASAIIEEPNTFTIDVIKTSDVVCFGTDTGEVTFELVDATYSTGFNWEIFRTDNTSVDSGSELANGPTPIINLGVGEYYVSISQTNNPFCTNVEFFNIAGPDADISGNTVVTEITCNPGTDGSITITDVVGGWGGYTYYVGVGVPATTDFVADAAFTGLGANTYQAWARDSEGCERLIQDNIVLDVPDLIDADLLVTQENCTNLQGEVTVSNVVGGQGSNYTYQLRLNGTDFRAPQNTLVFSGLGAGIYEVIVSDQWGCTFTTDPVELYEQLSATTSVDKAIDCTSIPGGTITINVTGGSTNLEFVMTPPTGPNVTQTNNPIFTGLTVDGSYSFLVRDLDTTNPVCELTVTQELAPAIQPVFTDSHIDITCFGSNDGSITLTQVENGVNPLTFTISPVAGTFNASNNTFEGLPPNTYVVTATGTNGCSTASGNIVIDEPLEILNVTTSVVEFGCTVGNNPNNATITVDETAITGGSGNYVIYEFVDSSSAIVQSGPSSVLTVINKAGDTYTINVYDDKGCSGSTTETILPFDEIVDAVANVSNTVTCAPISDGELTVVVTSTLSDATKFEYSIDNGVNYQPTNVFGGLSAGSYTILVKHLDTGCIVSATQTLVEPNTFTIDVVKTSDVICYGTATGAVNFELVDATYPGGFTWTIYDTEGTLANTGDDTIVISGTEATTNGPTADISLEAGSYYVSIRQDNNPFCTNAEAFTINGPTADISGDTVVTEITCNPGDDGSITIIDVVGGWGGYTYYVGVGVPATVDFVAGATFDSLTAGTYQAWARDAEGCEKLIQDNIVLDIPDPIAAILEVNIENCTNLQGEIEVSMPTGGQGSNYTYQLRLNGTDFRAPQNTRVFTGLGAGSYDVTIIDQWGCPFTTNAVVLYEQMDVSTTVDKSIDCSSIPGGEITVNVTGGSTNLEFIMTPPTGPAVTQANNPIFTGLVAEGTYSFLVRDLDTTNPVCERTVTQTLDAPVDPVLLDATIVNVSCFGGTDGSIRANIDPATNSNPEYQYELYDIADLVTPIATQTNPLFTGLPEGDYEVRVISSRGCEDIKNETITEPLELTVSAVATEFSCSADNSVNTATITATAGVGTGTAPYLYSIDNIIFQALNTFNVSDTGSAQTIDVYVKDAKGCTTFDTVTIQPINTFTASIAKDVAINCTVDETITITVADNGLAHNYGYELLPIGNATGTLIGTTATSATYELNTVGSYVFRVTDLDTGCYVNTASYTVAPFDFITATATATTAVTCFGELNGSLEIDVDGYTGNYTYEVFNAAGTSVIPATASDTSVNPRTITGLSGGSYYVTITETDIPLCSEDTNSVTIISPDRPLIGTVTTLAEATCTDDQGEIRVTAEGGYKLYDIVLTNTTTGDVYTMDDVNEAVFTDLAAGAYTVSITDDAGCEVNYTETLAAATPIVANATPLVTDLACYGDTGAVVTANVTGGGSGTYSYQLNYYDATGTTITTTTGAQTNPNFNDLGAGFYSVTVVDGWNCDTTTNTVEVREPTEVQASLIRTDALTCAEGAEFELTASGGSGSYEYSVDNINFLPMTGNVVYLPETGTYQAGRYQFYVRDAINGCASAISNAITESEIPPLLLFVDDTAAVLNCTGESTAIIYATADGGLGNYQYELFTDSSLSVASRIAGPQSQGVFRDLSAGTYYVTVISDDCETAPETVVIAEPTPLTYTESVIDITCSGENDGEITVTLSGGAGGYQYAISPNLNQFYSEGTFTELTAGEYTIIAQDQNGCFEYLTYTISEPSSLEVMADTTPEICVDSNDGSIILEITGGTAPYSTALNSNDDADFVLNRTEFYDMAAGNYLIVIKDANGCDTNVVVDIETGVNLNATVVPIYECSSDTPDNFVNITLEDDSVIGDVLYAIDSVDPAALQLNPDFRNSAPGNHYITIAHSNGCLQTIDFVIEAFEPLTLVLEQNNMNEITAVVEGGREGYTYYFDGFDNGDNNIFYVTRTDTYEVRVVDENGCSTIASIFMEFIDIEIDNFFTPNGDGQNDLWIPRNIEQYPQILIKIFDRYGRVVSEQEVDSEGWDGTYLDNELPTGDYWYVVKLNGDRDEREFVGHFTLYR